MSPRKSTLLALLGVMLAGIPLPALTATRRDTPPAATDSAGTPAVRRVYARLQCSGQPTELRVMLDGQELSPVGGVTPAADAPWEAEFTLPSGNTLALEVIACWPEGSPAQAATLTLEPDGLPSQQVTEWTAPGSNTLHALFPFSW